MLLVKAAFLAAVVAAADAVAPADLAVNKTDSIIGVANTLAKGAMSYYSGNASSFADLPDPYYWWEAGALMGAMLDYSYYTNDTTYDDIVATAILQNTGPAHDFIVPAHELDEGNDDQAFWGFTVLTAAEHNFTQPAELTPKGVPSWLDLSINVWNNMVVRWNTTKCAGGFTWQIYADNFNGLNYKNSASNGGFFLISARLALLTGNKTYVDWAQKVWDWTDAVGIIDKYYNVYDGTDSATNCTQINALSFSYQNGIFLYGAAALANHTGDAVWKTRAEGLLDAARHFFSPDKNATNIMWEHACEGVGTCTKDMKTFKGFLSRFMYSSVQVLPSLAPNVTDYMRASAAAAGKACTGANIDGAPTQNGTTCGQKWYVGGFDGSVGLGQEMCALETVQGLLGLNKVLGIDQAPPPSPSPTAPAPAPSPSGDKTKNASPRGMSHIDLRWTVVSMACALFAYGMA
ncbi:mannan endo-1,6-alpha-mannosidase [Sporothrix brasiliensis 5110]|uniref:Mannan endo-1,6-alpha-mannosidase n=1 Tax=Sporothrix brasiliensis 5110 TaxID=1398154 RepID=A0A0C2F7H8_9PEZI|nr:mannan endo-1,6-alpha-mannosidase [Sporothrix brasiliensis 5110]KIH94934.1 mannan endo-1,6-alpha-mannosidase [Sporothrix brasiliensis 5110]